MATRWSAYEYQPSFVLGFHGCDKSTAEKILSGKEPHLLRSEKKYDWLGHGIYFWEGNPSRALAWAEHRKSEKKIRTPTVVGAIIDLRHCLDLFDQAGISQVQQAHNVLTDAAKAFYEKVGFEPSPLDPHLLMITLADLIDANGARAGLGER